MNVKWMSTVGLSGVFVFGAFFGSAQEDSKKNSEVDREQQALQRVRSLFESKTQKCDEAIYAHMGPYAINEYRDVRYRTIRSAENPGEAVRVQAVAGVRQYWANDGKWRSWARHQIVLDLNITQDSSGELQVQPAKGADASGEDLKPITCDQVPKPDADNSTSPR